MEAWGQTVQPSFRRFFGRIQKVYCWRRNDEIPVHGGALPEVVGDAGIVVPVANAASNDPDAARMLAEAIASVVDSPDGAARLREAGLRRARLFRAEAVLPALLEVYRRALESHEAI